MIVADLTHAYHETSGGIRTYIDAKRRYLASQTNHTHGLVVPGASDRVESGSGWETRFLRCPVIPGAAPYRFFPGSRRPTRALLDLGVDAVELGTYYMPAEARAAFHARAAAQQKGRRIVVSAHIHTDFPRSYAQAYSARVLGDRLGEGVGGIAERYARSVLSRCDFVITLSEQFRDRMTSMGLNNVILVPQGVDLELFGPHRRDPRLRAELGIPPDGVFLLYSGRFDSEKHVDTLVRALDLLPPQLDATLVLMGDGPKRPDLERAAHSRPNLRVLPYQTDKERVAALLATADVYVTAGPHEVYAFSVVEAFASGTPVVGVAAGGLLSRVTEGLGYLVPVDDAQAFADRIRDIAPQSAPMGRAAREHAEREYSWSIAFEHILGATKLLLRQTLT